MNRLRASLLQTAILALAALCGSVRDAQAQAASPPPGKAMVVLYRADKQPVAGKVPVIANADRLGELGNKEFINAVVNPGRTFLRAGDRILTTLSLQTSAGQTYYVLMEAVPGQSPLRVDMREMTQGAARNALAQSRAAAPAAVAAPAAAAAAAAAAPRPATAAVAPGAAPPPPRPAPAAAPPPPRQAQTSPPPKPAPPPPSARPREPEPGDMEWAFAVIAKTGAFNLSKTSQSIGGQSVTYKKNSKPVAAVEGEFRRYDGYALGGELIYYKNDLTQDGTPFKGDQTVLAGFLNAKYYFEAASWLHPFVGVGLGYANATFGGDFTGKATGFAFQGMTGADIPFSDSVGLYLEYKFLSAATRDPNKQSIKADGSGILVGLSFVF